MRNHVVTIALLILLCVLAGCDNEGKDCAFCNPGDTCRGERECVQFEDFLYRCANPGDTCVDFFESPLEPELERMPADGDTVGISRQPSADPEPGFSPVDP